MCIFQLLNGYVLNDNNKNKKKIKNGLQALRQSSKVKFVLPWPVIKENHCLILWFKLTGLEKNSIIYLTQVNQIICQKT